MNGSYGRERLQKCMMNVTDKQTSKLTFKRCLDASLERACPHRARARCDGWRVCQTHHPPGWWFAADFNIRIGVANSRFQGIRLGILPSK